MELKDLIKNIKKINVVSLSHQIDCDFPAFSDNEKLKINKLSDYENGYLGHKVSFGTQFATHIDMPSHFIKNGRMLTDFKSY